MNGSPNKPATAAAEMSVAESGNSRRAATWAAWLICIAILAGVFVWGYGPAVFLPPSLLDEAIVWRNADLFVKRLAEEGVKSAFRNDMSVGLGLANPGMTVVQVIVFAMAGHDLIKLHTVKLVALAWVVTVTLLLGLLAGQRGQRVFGVGGACAALVAGTMLMLAEVPGWHTVHGLRANWYRLHTTDSTLVVFLGAHVVLFFAALRLRGRRSILFAAGAVLALVAAESIKVTAAAILLPAGVLALALWAGGDVRSKPAAWTAVSALAATLAYAVIPAILMTSAAQGRTYASSYSLAPQHLAEAASYFATSYRAAFGPLLALLAISVAVRAVKAARTGCTVRQFIAGNATLLYLLCAWLALTAVYLPWEYQVPRYMLPAVPWLCAAIGYEICQWSAEQDVSRRLFVLLFLSGALAVILLPDWLLLPVGAGALCLLPTRWPRLQPRAFLLGAFCVAFAWFVFSGVISQRALMASYVAGEYDQAKVLEEVVRIARTGRPIGVVGNAQDEQVFGLAYQAERRFQAYPEFRGVRSRAQAEALDVILVASKLGLPRPESQLADLKVIREYGAERTVYVPLRFRTLQRNLLRGRLLAVMPVQAHNYWLFAAVPD